MLGNFGLNIPHYTADDIEMNLNRALQYLKKEYPKNTIQAVYDIMSTGAEGGVYQILRTLARLMAIEISQNEITAIVVDYWKGLSSDEKLAAPEEYINKYKNILPREIVNRASARFKGSFLKVLEQHPQMIKRVRDLSR